MDYSYYLENGKPAIYFEIYLPKKSSLQGVLYTALGEGREPDKVYKHIMDNLDEIVKMLEIDYPDLAKEFISSTQFLLLLCANLQNIFIGYSMYEVDGVFFSNSSSLFTKKSFKKAKEIIETLKNSENIYKSIKKNLSIEFQTKIDEYNNKSEISQDFLQNMVEEFNNLLTKKIYVEGIHTLSEDTKKLLFLKDLEIKELSTLNLGKDNAFMKFNRLLLEDVYGDAIEKSHNNTSEERTQVIRLMFKYNQNIGSSLFCMGNFKEQGSLFITKIKNATDPISLFIQQKLALNQEIIIEEKTLVDKMNQIIKSETIYDKERFVNITLSHKTKQLLAQNPSRDELIELNRLLLEDAYPKEIEKNHNIMIELKRFLRSPENSLESYLKNNELSLELQEEIKKIEKWCSLVSALICGFLMHRILSFIVKNPELKQQEIWLTSFWNQVIHSYILSEPGDSQLHPFVEVEKE